MKRILLLLFLLFNGAFAFEITSNDNFYSEDLVFHKGGSIDIVSDCLLILDFQGQIFNGYNLSVPVNLPVGRYSFVIDECGSTRSMSFYVVLDSNNSFYRNNKVLVPPAFKPVNPNNYFVVLREGSVFDVAPYFSSYKFSEPDYEVHPGSHRVLDLAVSIAQGSSDEFEASERISSWVKNNMRYNVLGLFLPWHGYGFLGSDFAVLNNGLRGVCGDYNSLFISLARSLGIPSRRVTVLSVPNSLVPAYDMRVMDLFFYHGFSEVLLNDSWTALDPQFGFFDSPYYLQEIGYFVDQALTLSEEGVGLTALIFILIMLVSVIMN